MAELMTPAEAYHRCEVITRNQARNFAYGIRLLPKPKRQAMSALYAMARRIDDISDTNIDNDNSNGQDLPLSCAEKLAQLEKVRADIAALAKGKVSKPKDPVLVGLKAATDRFAIPIQVLNEIVEGCEQDAQGARYHTFGDTEQYCRLVAGSVGRLSLAIFGIKGDSNKAAKLADELGVALQITNILRDITEDRAMGRVYLPDEDIARFACHADMSGPTAAVGRLVAFEANRAEQYFATGLKLLDSLDYRSRACTGAMAGIYHRLLIKIKAAPTQVLSSRISLTTNEKLGVAARSLAGLRP